MSHYHDGWVLVDCAVPGGGMFDLWTVNIPEDAKPGHTIDVKLVPFGTWHHRKHGQFVIDESVLTEMVENFEAKLRGPEISFQFAEHQVSDTAGAYGWFDNLRIEKDGLWAPLHLTDIGLDIIRNRRFRFLSADMVVGAGRYKDEYGREHKNVLANVSPTNHPLFTVLTQTPLAASADNEELDDVAMGDEKNMPEKPKEQETVAASASPDPPGEDMQNLQAIMNGFRDQLEAAVSQIGDLRTENSSLKATISQLKESEASVMATAMVDGWKFSIPTIADGKPAQMTAILSPAHKELALKMLANLPSDVGSEFIQCMNSNGFTYVPLGEAPMIQASAEEATEEEELTDEFPEDTLTAAKQYILAHPGMSMKDAVNSVLAPPWAN